MLESSQKLAASMLEERLAALETIELEEARNCRGTLGGLGAKPRLTTLRLPGCRGLAGTLDELNCPALEHLSVRCAAALAGDVGVLQRTSATTTTATCRSSAEPQRTYALSERLQDYSFHAHSH